MSRGCSRRVLRDRSMFSATLATTVVSHAPRFSTSLVCARLSLSHGLGIIDALIAECAIGLGVPLCTFNVRHFSAVPGLVTERPYARV